MYVYNYARGEPTRPDILGLLGGYELARYAGGCAFVACMRSWRGVEYIARGGGWISCLHDCSSTTALYSAVRFLAGAFT